MQSITESIPLGLIPDWDETFPSEIFSAYFDEFDSQKYPPVWSVKILKQSNVRIYDVNQVEILPSVPGPHQWNHISSTPQPYLKPFTIIVNWWMKIIYKCEALSPNHLFLHFLCCNYGSYREKNVRSCFRCVCQRTFGFVLRFQSNNFVKGYNCVNRYFAKN